MQTITIKRYSFDELSPEAKEKAIENYRRSENENYPQELLLEAMKDKAADLLGADQFPDKLELRYNLSYSQGDGVSLNGSLSPDQAPALNWPVNSYSLELKQSGYYSHEYTFSAYLYDIEGDEIESDSLLSQLRDICVELKRFGYKFDENYFSDENMSAGAKELGDVWTSAGSYSDPVRE